ncbi:MAG TPA: hypothetical protein VL172_10975, partial [Kofleriaceae bacterium]|nr:hypothetical protein [Kofleriaceae bacterium]
GLLVPGAVGAPGVAARYARAFLDRHLALLAPGADPADFVQVSDHLGAGMRTIGFVQQRGGLPVLGGQVSFRFKADRLMLIGSEALPDVPMPPPRRLDDGAARRQALAWTPGSAGPVGELILPLVGDDRVRGYATVVRVQVDSRSPRGRWEVYLDAGSGAPVARRQLLRFAQATLKYNAPIRHALGTRMDYPAQMASLSGNTVSATTDDDGLFTWSAAGSVSITTGAAGPRVLVNNDAGVAASATFSVAPDATQVWNASTDQLVDAQLSAFVHARIAKEYARSFAPDLAWLDGQLVATVNIDDECNAFSDGDAINFFKSSQDCANTALISDVVYHETGHSVHGQSIIDGVGAFEPAFSEGLADFLAASITGDSGMGRGFFYTDDALRDIDPLDYEYHWPEDIDSDVHLTGLIFASAMWDLRKELIARYGETEGIRLTNQLYYAAVQRAPNIPATYYEILAADDDNGDLTDGTPNGCVVDATFGLHGLRAFSIDMVPLATEAPDAAGHTVTLTTHSVIPACAGEELTGASVDWNVRGDPGTGGTLAMSLAGEEYSAVIPDQPEGTVVQYQVKLAFADDTEIRFPDNLADPRYEFYIGNVELLYCDDFEQQDPFTADWVHKLDAGAVQEGADDWAWGTPMGTPGSGDPTAAFSGTNVIGNDLGGADYNGKYQPDKANSATGPLVDVGDYSDVHLQYRRWLNVEDGHFDKATIYANGQVAWQNFNSDMGNGSTIHHTDREWRYHDVPLSPFIADGKVQVKFELRSDGGLEMGGWNVDDVCIVALASSICGDGVVSPAEECDDGDGNSTTAVNGCRPGCKAAYCGDGVVDDGEVCDDGDGTDSGTCRHDCAAGIGGNDGGCCSTGGGAGRLAGTLLLAMLVAFGMRRR